MTCIDHLNFGALGGIRTSDLQYRKLTLYPAELRAHMIILCRIDL